MHFSTHSVFYKAIKTFLNLKVKSALLWIYRGGVGNINFKIVEKTGQKLKVSSNGMPSLTTNLCILKCTKNEVRW